ncbi:MAG: ABC-2 family transporter protein [Oscillospiraceae bacterium]|nr:ABC-2 family transporter protein [Oscillospiraceae bacterium]
MLYLKSLLIHLKGQMQYKMSFVFLLIGQFLTAFSAFLTIYVLMQRFHTVKGFTYPQVLLCFAVVLLSFSLAECFFRGFDTFSGIIANGQFDRILVRPRSAVYQVLCAKIELTRLGRLLQAVLVMVYAIPHSGVIWTADKIGVLVLMILGGVAVFSALFVLYAGICFFTIEGLEFMNIFTDGGREFGSYPISVFGESVLKFCTYVIPLALFQYYPLLWLLDMTDKVFYAFTPLIGALFWLPALLVWRLGVKNYVSTGS